MGIIRTTELQPNGYSEAGIKFERAWVGDALVNTKAHLLFVVRIVREHLLREGNRSRGEDLARVELVFNLVDLHVLPPEVEELV